MFRTSVAFVLLGSLVPLTAQQSLADLQQRFAQQARALGDGAGRAAIEALRAQQIAALRTFVEQTAAGDDRWNGRLMLADFQLASGDRQAASAALRTIQAEAAPALVLVTAATMAQHLGLDDLRGQWIDAAIAKPAPLAERMAMARLLTTVLHEIGRGEAIYSAALAAAADDEQRALVRWHRADAMRDREDLPDNAGFEELQKLATDLPKTRWGDVARDRLRATQLRPGDDTIHFRATTRGGSEVATRDLLGKAVVLVFWSGADRDLPRLLETLGPLQQRAGDGMVVLGICLDRDAERIDADVERLGITFPVIGDGSGIEQDVALRWFVEGPVVQVVDGKGKVAGLGLHAGTTDGRAQLREVIERAAGL
ncbi:MAG: TlpA family protein disulfide reductase [Planctomycetes bacterium]|nr:TlpA family protein disulfide reductase [Planctomycetota bacterium]